MSIFEKYISSNFPSVVGLSVLSFRQSDIYSLFMVITICLTYYFSKRIEANRDIEVEEIKHGAKSDKKKYRKSKKK